MDYINFEQDHIFSICNQNKIVFVWPIMKYSVFAYNINLIFKILLQTTIPDLWPLLTWGSNREGTFETWAEVDTFWLLLKVYLLCSVFWHNKSKASTIFSTKHIVDPFFLLKKRHLPNIHCKIFQQFVSKTITTLPIFLKNMLKQKAMWSFGSSPC